MVVLKWIGIVWLFSGVAVVFWTQVYLSLFHRERMNWETLILLVLVAPFVLMRELWGFLAGLVGRR